VAVMRAGIEARGSDAAGSTRRTNFFWAHATNSFAKFCMSSNSGSSSRAPIPIHSLTKSAHTLPAMP
jgi:hypothetical protein